MEKILVIIAGGALGALCRYGLGLFIVSRCTVPFPLHTFIINVSGAFLLGFCSVLFQQKMESGSLWWLGTGVGFLGAFTTFSTFSLETVSLISNGNLLTAALYTAASVGAGFSGAAAGIFLGRLVFSAG